MTLTRTLPTQNAAGLPLADERRIIAGMLARNADGTVRPGVIPTHANALITGRAEMAYDVAPFFAATSRSNTGAELVVNDAVTRVPTTAAPASNSRIDVIWVRAEFALFGDASNDAVFGVTQGAAAPVPSKPSIPAGALEIGTAVILSTTTQASTAVITPTVPYTAMAGADVWVRNATEMNAFTPPPGTTVLRLDNGQVYEYRTTGIGAPSNGWYSRSPHILRRMGNNDLVSGYATPIIKTGRASGTTNGAGVLVYTFPEAFPNGCVAVTLQTFQTITGNPVLLGSGTDMSATAFSTFWPGLASANVAVPYIAIGY